ncbi:DUF3473 domain-containing protein [candidate division WS5 bacterium]|uniref:DUF3473 domain-containing protein n=1 Tax=candidate division WS5 bacterium TaxID=2093353 RepID=A0A419DBE0_9BACT|nr:MAG: DUF3473 domain-containing protein [candidate division WS5 bacterium]
MVTVKSIIKNNIKNCLSFDIEGFIESNKQSFYIDKKYVSKSEEQYEIEKNTEFILAFLDEAGVKATFFFLGRICRDIPHVIKETARYGHEIACHSHEHLRIFGLTKDKFRENVAYAKKILEDVSGYKVAGFRAPDFSITKSNLWALDVLKETGFIYDSSICPTGIHDVYGIGDAEPFIHTLNNGLIEFPASTVKILGKRLPYAGGGYFRLYPLILTKYLIQKSNKNGQPCMFYLHPYEMGPVIPCIYELGYYRRFRHYYNCNKSSNRLKEIIQVFNFSTCIEILQDRGLINS